MMTQGQDIKFDWGLVAQLKNLIKPYWSGDKRRQAWWLLGLVVVFILLMSGLNAYKTYITKWAVDALSRKSLADFYHVIFLAVVFLGLSVPVTALKGYYQNKLGLYWRRWFNFSLLDKYFDRKRYYNMTLYSSIDNPDQRIAQDLNEFVLTATKYFSLILLSVISLFAYVGVLGSISWWLVLYVFLYATVGTVIIVFLTKKLVKVNFKNIRYQANYRYNLIHVRDNIESIAFYRGEKHEGNLLRKAFDQLIDNYRLLIIYQRNISFFSEAYILFAALIPFLVLAPSVIAGKVTIGTVIQATTVFAVVLNDLSIVVSEFQGLSTFAAVIQRLAGFTGALDVKGPDSSKVNYTDSTSFHLKDVTVRTPDLKKTLVTGLDFDLIAGSGVMIVGPSGCGKSSLLRALAGLWDNGQGEVSRPPMDEVMFLPQKPYMLIGSLRDQLVYPHLNSEISDQELESVLKQVNLNDLSERVGGMSVEMPWADLLSLGEQQRVIFTRLFLSNPKFAILDEATSALDEENEAAVYRKLRDSNTTFMSVGHRSSIIEYHDYILKLDANDGWELMETVSYLAEK